MDLKNATILVTGGAGAIGGQLCQALLKRGCQQIIALDDLSSGYSNNIPTGIEFIQGPILDQTILDQIFARPVDVVFHLAAHFANQNSIEHPQEDLAVNALGTLKLLEYSKKYGVNKFIYASSSCVYGNQSGAITEEAPTKDLETPYAISKLAGEHYTTFFNRFHKLNTVILRYFNSFGPGERPGPYRNVIPNFIAKALQGEPLIITGDGSETRAFTSTFDIVEGTLRAAEVEKSNGNVYNIGIDQARTMLEVAQTINRLTGNTAPIKFAPRRSWDCILHRHPDISQARVDLGFNPSSNFEEQIMATIQWFKDKRI